MRPEAELEQLLTDIESDRVERKAAMSDPERICQAICAFANDLPGYRSPGYVFVGADDAGKPTRFPITDQVLLTLADMRSSGNILPVPTMVVQKVTLLGVPVAVVEVHPAESPPVRYKGQVWIRVGPRRATATLEEERRLVERQVAGVRTFDQRPSIGASLADLLLDVIQNDYLPRFVDPKRLMENRRTMEDQLASLRFFDLKAQAPTHAGILLFGRDPLQFLPGAYLQFVRFDGRSLADPVQDDKILSGSLLTQLSQLDNLLPIQIRVTRVPASGLQQGEQPDYPLVAIRELAMNGLMHRSYEGTSAPLRINWFSDRVEIQSPGGLYGQVTSSNYERMTDYRNPVIAEGMKALGYVERFGTGIARANASLERNGNRKAEFCIELTHVLVTVWGRS